MRSTPGEGGRGPWCSMHVYYHTNQDRLLVEWAADLVESLLRERMIVRAFFLRYWLAGPHVRLRMLARDEGLAEGVTTAARDSAVRYLADHPSRSGLSNEEYEQASKFLGPLEGQGAGTLAPNNSVTVERYEPEYGKYGGPQGVQIAEEVFDASTRSAFMLIPRLESHDGLRLGTGLAMMLIGMLRFDLAQNDLPETLAAYSRLWRPYAPASLVAAWEGHFTAHQQNFERVASAVLEGRAASQPALAIWDQALAKSCRAILSPDADVLQRLVPPYEGELPQRRARSVLFNYLHTNNNRLGVLPGEEAYLAFAGERTVRGLLG